MERRLHRAGPDSDEIPRPRRTSLVRDNQTVLNCGTGRPGERSRAVTHDSLARNSQHVWISVSRTLSLSGSGLEVKDSVAVGDFAAGIREAAGT
jgi:hypothetical protein